jgi:hypothetical protein
MPPAPPLSLILPGEFVIRTWSGHYLTAVGGGGRTVDTIHTDAVQVGSWEKFRLWVVDRTNSKYAIQTTSGNFLTAVGGGGQTTDVLHTNATQVQSWEIFRLVNNPMHYGTYAIQTASGNFLTALGGGGHADPPAVHTDATTVDDWETYSLLKIGDLGSGFDYSIWNYWVGGYLFANGGGGRTTDAILNNLTSEDTWRNARWTDEATRFKLLQQADGTFALQTVNGQFVTADDGGGIAKPGWSNLLTVATQIQSWEKFKVVSATQDVYVPFGYNIQTVSGGWLGSDPKRGIWTNVSDPSGDEFYSTFWLTMFL